MSTEDIRKIINLMESVSINEGIIDVFKTATDKIKNMLIGSNAIYIKNLPLAEFTTAFKQAMDHVKNNMNGKISVHELGKLIEKFAKENTANKSNDEIDEAFIAMVNNNVKHLLEAAPKLTKNSPPEAKFHRGMREWHKEKASEARANGDKKLAELHKKMVDHHHLEYRTANGA